METKKFDIDVEIFGIPETPLFQHIKIKGSAKVHIKTFGLTLKWIPWTVSENKVKIHFPGFKRKVDGKYKCFHSISFTDRRLEKVVCRLTKSKILLGIEDVEKKAIELKKKKKKQHLAELKVFLSLPKEKQEEILWPLWINRPGQPEGKKSDNDYEDRDYGEWLRQHQNQMQYTTDLEKFETWKKKRLA